MKRSIAFACVLGVLGSVGLPACSSGGSSGNQTSFSSGLAKDAPLGGLSDADVSKLCDAIGNYYTTDPALAGSRCHIAGVAAAGLAAAFGGAATDADLQKACSDAESACKKAPPSNADAGASTCTKPTGTCTATVGEFEACVTDSTAAVNSVLANLPSCATITKADLGSAAASDGGGTTTRETPASCATVDQKCPSGRSSTGV